MVNYIPLYNKEFTEIGVIRRAHGYKGHAKLQLDEDYIDLLNGQEYLFIEIDGYKVPFKIESLEIKRDIIIKLKGLSSSEDLNKFHMCSIHLLSKDVPVLDQIDNATETFGVDMVIFDTNTEKTIGKIIRIDQYPQQSMAIVIIDDNEVLIPLHEDLISAINSEEKQILMNLPEGLI